MRHTMLWPAVPAVLLLAACSNDGASSGPLAPISLVPEPGRMIAQANCSSCHGEGLAGGDGGPSMSRVAEYSRADFNRLMSMGRGIDGRDIDCGPAPRQLTAAERTDLYDYLRYRFTAAGYKHP